METIQYKEKVTQKRRVKKVVVLGAGIMGSRIACHFANIGVKVHLLDIVPKELTEEEKGKGLTLESPIVRNRIVNTLFEQAVKSSPSPIYHERVKERIQLGNFEDDLPAIAEADWIIEAVVENLEIKRNLYERIERFRRPGTLITTNTSGIPIRLLAEGRSEDFQRHFCGTHFFNPPRYLPLLEIIPHAGTDPEVIAFLMDYGDRFLGKRTVLCKDTPAFIANRVGIFAIMHLLHLVPKYGSTVEEVDELTGPLIGHPKSATFRTADLVGLDTAVKVAQGIYTNCPHDEQRDIFQIPNYIQFMVDNQLWGDKTGKGFYKKEKVDGKSVITSFDFETKTYREMKKVASPLLEQLRNINRLEERLAMISRSDEPYARFLQESMWGLFAYVSHRIPEIADALYQIDDAMRAGFGWKLGPFEKWDAVGLSYAVEQMEKNGFPPAPWVKTMLHNGFTSFYKVEKGTRYYYDIASQSYKEIPGRSVYIVLNNLRETHVVWRNEGATLFDLGDGILCLEFHTKMNTLGGEVLDAINRSLDLAEQKYEGLVIGNQGDHFSAGANLALIFMLAAEQEFDELDYAVRYFQRTVMRIRYSGVPVVVAPHNLTLGGGCELTMHADAVQAAAETYIGLVEVGVGLIPAGGGTKEMVLRFSQNLHEGDIETNLFRHYFMTIAQAKVSTSALEAYDLGYLRPGVDNYTVNPDRLLSEAKERALWLARRGYTQPIPEKRIRVLGRTGLGIVEAGVYQMRYAGYITEHDATIARKLGYVMCGGDLSSESYVDEFYLLDLEREAFLSLCGERKTLERMQHMLQTGKPLRN
jgi:3-hydroxyacyl-CoA dehydrogenase